MTRQIRFVVAAVLTMLCAVAQGQVPTGSWFGSIDGNDVEIAVWTAGPAAQGYLFASQQDCFVEVAFRDGKFEANALTPGSDGKVCRSVRRFESERASGVFVVNRSAANTIDLTLHSLNMFGPAREELNLEVKLTRGAISSGMRKVATSGTNANRPPPTPLQLAELANTPGAVVELAGAWQTNLDGKPIEIALWRSARNVDVFHGYLHSPSAGCFIKLELSGGNVVFRTGWTDTIRGCPENNSSSHGEGQYQVANNNRIDLSLKRPTGLSSQLRIVLTKRSDKGISQEMFMTIERGGAQLPPPRDSANYFAVASSDTKNGLIVRPRDYWVRYSNLEVRDVFAGRFPRTDQVDFWMLYTQFQAAYGNRCPLLVPDGIEITIQYYTEDPSGVRIDDGPPHRILIRRQYYPKYQELIKRTEAWAMKSVVDSALAEARERGSMLRLTSLLAKEAITVATELNILFNDSTCGGGFLQQFDENLRRMANGEPSLQTLTGATFPYASRDVDRMVVTQPTLGGVCFNYYTANNRMQDEEDRYRWCNCIDSRMKLLLPSEIPAAMRDFTATEIGVRGQYPLGELGEKYSAVRSGCLRN